MTGRGIRMDNGRGQVAKKVPFLGQFEVVVIVGREEGGLCHGEEEKRL